MSGPAARPEFGPLVEWLGDRNGLARVEAGVTARLMQEYRASNQDAQLAASMGVESALEELIEGVRTEAPEFIRSLLANIHAEGRDPSRDEMREIGRQMRLLILDRASRFLRRVWDHEVQERGDAASSDGSWVDVVATRALASGHADSTVEARIDLLSPTSMLSWLDEQIASRSTRLGKHTDLVVRVSRPRLYVQFLVALGYDHTEVAQAINEYSSLEGDEEITPYETLRQIHTLDWRYESDLLEEVRETLVEQVGIDPARVRRSFDRRVEAWEEMLRGAATFETPEWLGTIEDEYARWFTAAYLAGVSSALAAHEEAVSRGGTPRLRGAANDRNRRAYWNNLRGETYPWLQSLSPVSSSRRPWGLDLVPPAHAAEAEESRASF